MEMAKMNDLLNSVSRFLSVFLASRLSSLSNEWWRVYVLGLLDPWQQQIIQEQGIASLEQLDLITLLTVLDRNWVNLADRFTAPREGRTWIKELQAVHKRLVHLPPRSIPAVDRYRYTDALTRVLEMLGADAGLMHEVEKIKNTAIAEIADEISESSISTDNNSDDSNPEGRPVTSGSTPAHKFRPGELVALCSDPGMLLPIIEVIPGGAECRYIVFQNNRKVTFYESQLRCPVAIGDDQVTLSIEDLHACLTSIVLLFPSSTNLFSLRSGRVQFVPYQYRPVLKLIRADRPRLLIADEVGVGKTIEAGLIIKELQARMDITSVLIICPRALVAERKWALEMKRFDEHFFDLDGPQLRHCLKETHFDGEWPEQYAKAIVPFSLFDSDLIHGRDGKHQKNSQGLLALDPPPRFDLVIVDEAHHIRNPETYLHQGVRYFCDNAQATLFLTATPIQLGSEDLFTLLNVLRPDLVIDRASFEQMAAPNRPINIAVQHCREAGEGWQARVQSCLDEVAQTTWGRLFLYESPAYREIYGRLSKPIDDIGRVALTRALEELYTFSPLINRTRRRDIGEFTTRKPETVTIDFTPDQKRLHDDLLGVITRTLALYHGQQNVKFMMTTLRRQAASCLYGLTPMLNGILNGKLDQLEGMEGGDVDDIGDGNAEFVGQVRKDIESVLEQAENLDLYDPKVSAFIKILQEKSRMPNKKALVFSTFRHTLAYLAKNLHGEELRFGLVHGGVPDEERAELRRRFALPGDEYDALDVLLSSEVGCEGLDFQFCDLLVNYDIPWNPMRIEQRIGRIDRYGQKSETIAIINFITPGTIDAEIYERCLCRIGIFQHALGGSEEILGTITQELHSISENFTLTSELRAQRLQQLADNSIRQVQEEHALEAKQAELFGLTVPAQSWRQDLDDAESFWLSPASLQHCVVIYLEKRLETVGEHLLGEKSLKTLRLSQQARALLLEDYMRLSRATDTVYRQWEKWLKGTQPILSVTFDQDTAAREPKATYLNVLHPLVRQAAHYLARSEPVHVSLTVQSDEVRDGEYPFALYLWQKRGVKSDESLVAVSTDKKLEDRLMKMLPNAMDYSLSPVSCADQLAILDDCHHSKWNAARANHIAQNHELVEHRIQSLTSSHRARCMLLEEQIRAATHSKILLMKQSELTRANADFKRRLDELQKARESGDIHATPVVFGVLAVTGRGAV